MPALAQGADAALAHLIAIDGHLIHPETGEVVGPVPALDLVSDRDCESLAAKLWLRDNPLAFTEAYDGRNHSSNAHLSLYVKHSDFPAPADATISPSHLGQQAHGTRNSVDLRRPSAAPSDLHLSPRGLPWSQVATYKGRKVTRCIDVDTRTNAIEAAGYAADAGHPFTVLLTQAPDLDAIDPAERVGFWQNQLRKLHKACEHVGAPFHYMRSRESSVRTHTGEHAHFLIAVPQHAIERWTDIVLRQLPNSDVRRVYDLPGAVAYLLKAMSPQSRAANPDAFYRRSGAIAGDRVLVSRSIDRKAREKAYAADPALVERREGRLRMEATDKRIAKDKRIEAGRRRAMERNRHDMASIDPLDVH